MMAHKKDRFIAKDLEMEEHLRKEVFHNLVENALDFLTKATGELEDSPKYSVIHFYAAVELFLKARLMSEHWTLIVTKRREPDWDQFKSGDFISVSLDEAFTRLGKIVNDGLTNKERNAFNAVRLHRNRMVHFSHPVHLSEQSQSLLRTIAREQLTAWYFLHLLLSERWAHFFDGWQEQIQKIDSELMKHSGFLQVIFTRSKDDISSRKAEGMIFQKCPSCGFEADEHPADRHYPHASQCLICDLARRCLTIECPDCQTLVDFSNEGFADCGSCGRHLEPPDVVTAIEGRNGAAYIYPEEGDGPPLTPAHCGTCGATNSVVETRSEAYVCCNCFEESGSVEFCENCNEPNTNLREDSYLAGCQGCDGRSWERD